MLATGGVTYAALNKSFPTVGKPKRTGPRRIRIGADSVPYAAPEEDFEEGDEAQKSAAFRHNDMADAGDEFLASFVAASRGDTITGDFISKAASGELEAMEQLLKTAGIDALLVSLKGASSRPIPGDKRMLGAMALFKSAALKDTVRAIATAEYLEYFGDAYAEFSGDPKLMRKMASLGCLMGVIARDSALPEMAKEAAAMVPDESATSPKLLGLLKQLIAAKGTGGGAVPASEGGGPDGATHKQREDRDAALTSDAGGGIGGIAEEGSAGGPAAQESTGDDDAIDLVLSPDTDNSEVLQPSD